MTAQTDFTTCPVHEAIARAKAECSPVGKDGFNPQQNFKFRGVDAVVNGAARALNRYGVIITPMVKLGKIEKRTYQSKGGATMLHVLVPVLYRLWGADGSGPVEIEVVGEASDAGDKGISKATSVAYRIMLLQVLNLPTGDPDPDAETHERDNGAAAGGDPWANGRRGRSRGHGSRRQQAAGNGQPRQPQPMKPRPPLDGDDPWKAKVEELSTAEDARSAEAELEELWKAGQIDDDRANQILYAIRQRFPKGAPHAGRAVQAAGGDGAAAPQQPTPERLAAARPEQQAPGEEEWVRDFYARLAQETDPGKLPAMRREVGQAVMNRILSTENSAVLTAAVNNRRSDLEKAGAPA